MTWFVVRFLTVTEVLDGHQEQYPIDEDFYLFEAHSDEELENKIQAEIEMINRTGADGVTYYGKPAKSYCLGVRKISTIINNKEGLDIDKDPPNDGTWLNYSFMTTKTLDDAKLLAQGKAVYVRYIDSDNQDDE